MQHDVFISYKSEEFEEADMLRTNLQANGITCWMAPESIPGGSDYATEITQAMEQCRCLVLVMSARAQTSQWIAKEVDLAFRKGKKVLPFMIEKCALAKNFDYYFTNVQYYYAYQNRGKAFRRLVADIRAEIGAPPTKAPVVIPVSAPKKKGMALWGIGGAILGVVLAVAVIALVVGEVGSPLLGIDNPTAQLTTGQSVADTTVTQLNGDATSSSATETSTTTTTVTAPSGEAFVVGAASLDATIDYGQLPTNVTSNIRQTAMTMPFDASVGAAITPQDEHWYTFTTRENVVVYLLGGQCVWNTAINRAEAMRMTIYNDRGMKVDEIYVNPADTSDRCATKYLILDTNTTYYLKVKPDADSRFDWSVGYRLFLAPRESDTGITKETATEIYPDTENTFVLNAATADWLKFTAEENGKYTLTLYNVDAGVRVNVSCRDVSGTLSLGSTSAADGDSARCIVYTSQGGEVYVEVKPSGSTDHPNGTYIIVVEKTS